MSISADALDGTGRDSRFGRPALLTVNFGGITDRSEEKNISNYHFDLFQKKKHCYVIVLFGK